MKQRDIIHCMKKYAATGSIDDQLIEFYDQHGKWRGDTISWRTPVPYALQKKMSKSFLPTSRRTCRGRPGTALRTSFVWHGHDPVTVNYSEIHGSMLVLDNAPIYAPSLRRIGGNLISNTKKQVDLPWLQAIGGHVKLLQTFRLNAPRLRNVGGNMMIADTHPPLLETVGGRYGAYWSFSFKAFRLKRIGGSLVLSKADSVDVPALVSVGGGILLTHRAKRIDAPRLSSVGGDFLAGSASSISVPVLRIVGGDFDTHNAKGIYHPRIQVGGEWTVYPGDIREWEIREAVLEAIRGDPSPLEI